MNLETKQEKNTLVVEVDGELDLVTAEQFKIKVEQKIAQSGAINLVLDLKKTTFIDSSGLGVILGRYKTITQNNGVMAVINPSAPVQKILELSGILRIICIYQDLTTALAAM